MDYLKRSLTAKLTELFEHFPVVALVGARQVGKTTLVEKLPVPGLRTVTFDPVQDLGGAREDPDFFLQNLNTPVFFDEIQYAPELLGSIKRAVDKKKEKSLYFLSGSQNLSVLKTISESLAGRVAVAELYPLSLRELTEESAKEGFLERFIFDSSFDPLSYACKPPVSASQILWRGGFPGVLSLPDHLLPQYFQSYMQTYVERDVRTASQIESLQKFGHFVGLLAAHTSGEINHSQLGRELGVDYKTAQSWTSIAAATFQWFEIPAYSRNAIKKIAGKPKGYFSDTGFACYLHRIGAPDVLLSHPHRGQLFETWVVLEVKKIIESWDLRPSLYHFRAYSGAEVDLLLDINGVIYPVEIKMSSNPSARDAQGITAFRKHFPRENIGPGLIVSSSETVRKINDTVYTVPWWEL